MPERASEPVRLLTVLACWGGIGCIGFGGPPAHLALLRQLCVTQRNWISAHDFEDGIAATSLLPGPASTQMAIWCAWRVRGRAGAIVGGLAFIGPGLIIIVGLSVLFLAQRPPRWVLGAAAGAGAAVPAVAVHAATSLLPASWGRAGQATATARGRLSAPQARWGGYVVGGIVAGGPGGGGGG